MFRTSRATVVGLVACLSAAETVQAGFSMEDVLRVLGGSDASTTDYPWMASVEVVSGTPNGDVSFFCGGILIAPSWVLTAAHCTDAENLQAANVVVGKKETCFNQDCTNEVNFREANDIFVPSAWKGTFDQPTVGVDLGSDVALVELNRPVTTITPVQISSVPFANDAALSEKYATALGWGLTDQWKGTAYAANLQALNNLGLINRNDCRSSTYNYPDDSYIADTAFCAKSFSVGKDTCNGDSGGPLYEKSSNTVVGITSIGYKCGEPGYPGVYTDIGSMYSWIISKTGALTGTTTAVPAIPTEYEMIGQGCCEPQTGVPTVPDSTATSGMSVQMCEDSCSADSNCEGFMFAAGTTTCALMPYKPFSRNLNEAACQAYQCYAVVSDENEIVDATTTAPQSTTYSSTGEPSSVGPGGTTCSSGIGRACRRGGRVKSPPV